MQLISHAGTRTTGVLSRTNVPFTDGFLTPPGLEPGRASTDLFPPRVGRRFVFACRMLQSIRLYGPGTISSERVLNANGRPSARQTERNMDTRGSGSVGSVVAVKPQPGVGGAAPDLSCCACALIFFRSPSQASLMSPAERIIHPVPPSPHAAAFSHSPSTFSAPFLALSLGAPPRALPQTMAVPAL